jgi:hypothetical protein
MTEAQRIAELAAENAMLRAQVSELPMLQAHVEAPVDPVPMGYTVWYDDPRRPGRRLHRSSEAL